MTDLCVYAGQTLPGPIYSIAAEVVTALYATSRQGERYCCLESLVRISVEWLRRFGEVGKQTFSAGPACGTETPILGTELSPWLFMALPGATAQPRQEAAEAAEHLPPVTRNRLTLFWKVKYHSV